MTAVLALSFSVRSSALAMPSPPAHPPDALEPGVVCAQLADNRVWNIADVSWLQGTSGRSDQ